MMTTLSNNCRDCRHFERVSVKTGMCHVNVYPSLIAVRNKCRSFKEKESGTDERGIKEM